MGTKSTISIVNPDGTVRSIYVQSDGHVNRQGYNLFHYYNNEDRVNKLIDLGWLQYVGRYIDAPAGMEHSMDFQIPDTTLSHFRDSDINHDLDIFEFKDVDDWFQKLDFRQFNYVFYDNEWSVSYMNSGIWANLTEERVSDDDRLPKTKAAPVSLSKVHHFMGTYSPAEGHNETFYICGNSYAEVYGSLVKTLETEFLDDLSEESCQEFLLNGWTDLNKNIIGTVLTVYQIIPNTNISYS